MHSSASAMYNYKQCCVSIVQIHENIMIFYKHEKKMNVLFIKGIKKLKRVQELLLVCERCGFWRVNTKTGSIKLYLLYNDGNTSFNELLTILLPDADRVVVWSCCRKKSWSTHRKSLSGHKPAHVPMPRFEPDRSERYPMYMMTSWVYGRMGNRPNHLCFYTVYGAIMLPVHTLSRA